MSLERVSGTPEERRHVRRGLIAAGFERTGYTEASGDGTYEEIWHSSLGKITLKWGVKL